MNIAVQALRRAADWLEANPSRHTNTVLARTDAGHEVEPFDPQATCFCAFGRFIVELDAVGEPVRELFSDHPIAQDSIAEVEGYGLGFTDTYIINDNQPHRAVVKYLRDLANQLEA